jgi:hypothetical protein
MNSSPSSSSPAGVLLVLFGDGLLDVRMAIWFISVNAVARIPLCSYLVSNRRDCLIGGSSLGLAPGGGVGGEVLMEIAKRDELLVDAVYIFLLT